MMRYKVGDKVKIRRDLEDGQKYGIYVVQEMQNLGGKTARITEVIDLYGMYHIDLDRYYWTDEMFEGGQ